jgi:hypothetical protein
MMGMIRPRPAGHIGNQAVLGYATIAFFRRHL